MAAAVAIVGFLCPAAWGEPTYEHSVTPAGGGLYGYTFWCENIGATPSAWFVEMEWWGASQAELDAAGSPPGAIPGTMINQVLAYGNTRVDEEADADMYHGLLPGSNYHKDLDTWIMDEFGHALMSCTQGPNYYERESGTEAGVMHVTVGHAYIVCDGSLAFAGRLGTGNPVPFWTDVSGVIPVPEPATLALLALGACLPLLRRRR
ncbi:MAG: hypothetical protein AMJ81_08630 [Phycisphaerae bacterium SM23_33]|nr:MAG: hypothetical protein AMJ81_08630 [Phycisphaerae bacterium SM23_33]